MPMFEYKCAECEATFERLVLGSQTTPQITCPQCGSVNTTKIFSTFSTSAGSKAPNSSAGAPAFR